MHCEVGIPFPDELLCDVSSHYSLSHSLALSLSLCLLDFGLQVQTYWHQMAGEHADILTPQTSSHRACPTKSALADWSKPLGPQGSVGTIWCLSSLDLYGFRCQAGRVTSIQQLTSMGIIPTTAPLSLAARVRKKLVYQMRPQAALTQKAAVIFRQSQFRRFTWGEGFSRSLMGMAETRGITQKAGRVFFKHLKAYFFWE